MRFLTKKHILVFILLLQALPSFAQVDPAFKRYNGAIISTLSIGLAMQTAGIGLLAYSNNYFLKEVAPLQAE